MCYSWVPRQGCEAVLNISILWLPNKREDVLQSGDLAEQSLLFFETFLLLHWFSRSSLNLGSLSCFLQVCELHSSFLSLHTTEGTVRYLLLSNAQPADPSNLETATPLPGGLPDLLTELVSIIWTKPFLLSPTLSVL